MQSLDKAKCPSAYSPHLQALWFDCKNDWDQSHRILQGLQENRGSRWLAIL